MSNPDSPEEETEAWGEGGGMDMTCSSSHNYVWKSQIFNPGVFTPEPMKFSIPQVASGIRDPEENS